MLAKGLSILLVLKNQLFDSLILYDFIFSLNLFDLIPDHYFISISAALGFGLFFFVYELKVHY
jgi:hypothetical protein